MTAVLPVRADCSTEEVLAAHAAHRARLLDRLRSLPDAAWEGATRCDGWSVRDVVTHLITVDQFFGAAWKLGLAGDPPRLLEGFDPNRTPQQVMQAAARPDAATTLAAFEESTDRLIRAAASVPSDRWTMPTEVPPGFVPWTFSLLHAFWDSWVHERDVFVPLGAPGPPEPDEVRLTGLYALVLCGLMHLRAGRTIRFELPLDGPGGGTYVLDVSGEVAAGWRPGAASSVGGAVAVLESITGRGSLGPQLPPGLDALARVLNPA